MRMQAKPPTNATPSGMPRPRPSLPSLESPDAGGLVGAGFCVAIDRMLLLLLGCAEDCVDVVTEMVAVVPTVAEIAAGP